MLAKELAELLMKNPDSIVLKFEGELGMFSEIDETDIDVQTIDSLYGENFEFTEVYLTSGNGYRATSDELKKLGKLIVI